MKGIKVIEGKKVNLRLTKRSDLEDYKRWESSQMRAFEFDTPWKKGKGLKSVIEEREKYLAEEKDDITSFMELETKDGEHIGWVKACFCEEDPHLTTVRINIIEDLFWRRGIGTEALALWVDYLFDYRRVLRLGIETWSGNNAIITLAKKLGFIEEVRTRSGCSVKGEFYDRIYMGILKKERELICKG